MRVFSTALCLMLGSEIITARCNAGIQDAHFSGGDYVEVKFYSASLTLPLIPDMATLMPSEIDEAVFRRMYSHFESREYQPFLKKIGDYRRGMSLSDWHFYDILADYSEQAFPSEGRNFQVLFQWFVLRKSGIDARPFRVSSTLYLNVLNEDIEFGFYLINQGGRTYANLTARREGLKMDNLQAAVPEYIPDMATMPFSMQMTQLPHLPSVNSVERLMEFRHRGEAYRITVFLNEVALQVMDEYPYYSQRSYFDVGMSREAECSLLPALQGLMNGRTEEEKVKILLSFTRTAFFYKDDCGQFGKEKPLMPEETLYHTYSDCEDRSALFFYLCRKLIGLPEIVLDFDTHIGCAVVLEGVTGEGYDYKNRRFVYCEPTGPQDSLEPGEMWDKFRSQHARILAEYIPE
jgi:hypothetical protein